MKNTIFSAIIFLTGITFPLLAQVNIIRPGDAHFLNDSTIWAYGNDSNPISVALSVVNPVNIKQGILVRRDLISTVNGSTNSFCWGGSCWGATVDSSPSPIPILGNDTLTAASGNGLIGDYNPNGKAGITTIRYTFFNSVNRADSAWVLVEYNAVPAGIAGINATNISFSVPEPNPGKDRVLFNYNVSRVRVNPTLALSVFNSIGQCVKTIPLNANNQSVYINVNDLAPGLYICKLSSGGDVAAYQKLLVVH